jgi:hypothetical protein
MRRQIIDGQIVINICQMVSTGPNTVVKRLLFSTNTYDRVGHMNPLDDIISYATDLDLDGDILITCHNTSAIIKDEKIFRFAFHTGFIPNENVLRLRKCDMDEACHNKTTYIPDNFMIDLMFDDIKVSGEETDIQDVTGTHDHLYAKTDPNTRNHILLEYTDDPVQSVIKKKLTSQTQHLIHPPKPLPHQNGAPVPQQQPPQPQQQQQQPQQPQPQPQPQPIVPPNTVAPAPVVYRSSVAPSHTPIIIPTIDAEESKESPRTPTTKPDILVLVQPCKEETSIVVKFRIKKQK